MTDVMLGIGDFLGFCDMNGVEALSSEQVQDLEDYIRLCNEKANDGDALVADAIYDRLIDILRQVNPDSDLCKYIWEDSVDELDDTDNLLVQNPMYSIQTVKSYTCQELRDFVGRLPDGVPFDMFFSAKLNGHGIRLKYRNGVFINARSRARSSAGKDITPQLKVVLESNALDKLNEIEGYGLCEVRGEWVLSFVNLSDARVFNPEIKSAFSGVASMGRDSATPDEWALLDFIAYEFIADGVTFNTKEEEYDFLEGLGFQVPAHWLVPDMNKETFIEDLQSIMQDCEEGISDYDYYTDGIVGCINSTSLFRSLGDDGSHYRYGNLALKLGRWEQNTLTGYVQCILWTKGKVKLSPVAVIAEEPNVAMVDSPIIYSQNEVANWKDLGVLTQTGNSVRRIPLYEPANILLLDAYVGNPIHFRYGGEAGVVPCYEDGTPLVDGRIREVMGGDADSWGFE